MDFKSFIELSVSKSHFITLGLLICCFGCRDGNSDPTSAKELVQKHLERTSSGKSWNSIHNLHKGYTEEIVIGNNFIGKSKKEEYFSLPNYYKLETYSGDDLSDIILINKDSAVMVKFQNGQEFANIIENTIPEITPSSLPVSNFKSWTFNDTILNDKKFYKLVDKKSKTEYFFNTENYYLISKIENTPYGRNITDFKDFRNIEGFIFPFSIIGNIEDAQYTRKIFIDEIQIGKNIDPQKFSINDYWFKIKEGDKLPKFNSTITTNGKKIGNSDLAGKLVLIDFWATWCKPCIKEFPHLRELYDKYHEKGFEIVGISLDQNKVALDNFLLQNSLPWITTHEISAFESEVVKTMGVASIPRTILVNKEGIVIAMDNKASGSSLAELVGKVLNN